MLSMYCNTRSRKKPLRFFNRWVQDRNFMKTVQRACNVQIRGCKMYNVFRKLKAIKGDLSN